MSLTLLSGWTRMPVLYPSDSITVLGNAVSESCVRGFIDKDNVIGVVKTSANELSRGPDDIHETYEIETKLAVIRLSIYILNESEIKITGFGVFTPTGSKTDDATRAKLQMLEVMHIKNTLTDIAKECVIHHE